ncbi:DUF2563 family protein [Mycobacterium shigaense]|uniref:Uncharacterized protein n=1 Tax=Mycobacterium shigaense TaxID=722731 RepID=A0A1Z4EJE5_9MYCO|nr:DUF2563 family protein [Mycobacterium shigaense]MEA1123272.1 DUF2563 family protein [Mycobacterium shigaense]PRI13168.1 hypothetical protein B2J96_22120 [Mycobacterium shigaense]BAX93105.1 hypothetical protein MSG_02964 [Mycobacterium shigaense]
MFVNPQLLHSGGHQTHRAADHAQDAANHLSRAALPSGMFGDFPAADDFHNIVSAAHAHHAKTLQAHHETLNGIGRKAHRAATEFVDMDERNAAELQAIRPQ